jgi:hypothetical protein
MSNDPRQRKLDIAEDAAASVPTFACIVYVAKTADGVRARVANLPDLQFTGRTEREVLGRIIPAFKQQVGQWLTAGEEIPWLEPPLPIADDEQKRFVPVHL